MYIATHRHASINTLKKSIDDHTYKSIQQRNKSIRQTKRFQRSTTV